MPVSGTSASRVERGPLLDTIRSRNSHVLTPWRTVNNSTMRCAGPEVDSELFVFGDCGFFSSFFV